MDRNQNAKADSEPEYQYNKAQYHPIEEYKITKTEKLTSDTPAFVLEVRWPRVTLFYHPASPLCKELRDRYVAVAREIRRRSIRAPVEFWAISCQVHRDACEELGVTAVPRLLAFPAGKIDPILIQRTQNNDIEVEDIVNVLDVNLKDIDEEEAQKREQQLQEELKLREIEQRAKNGEDPYQMHIGEADHMAEILHPHSSLADVYKDAMASLLYSFDLAVEKDRRGRILPWSYEKYHSFREWLDLMHWSLPTRDMASVHNIVNDLRSNAETIKESPDEVSRILNSHSYYKTKPEWSHSCRDSNQQDGGFACGFWKLLHVTSIGVSEQHKSVMGDLNRVMVPHVLQVIKDYIDFFGFATSEEGQKLVLEQFDECSNDTKCRANIGMEKKGLLRKIFRRRTLPKSTDKSWKELSLWLWKVHQKYRSQRLGRTKQGYDSLLNVEDLQWPPAILCSKCYSTRGMPEEDAQLTDDNLIVDTINQIMWNKMPVFNHLKHEYWPRALQTPRVVVLDKWDNHNEKSLLERMEHSPKAATVTSFSLIGFLLILGLFYGVSQGLIKLPVKIAQGHRRRDHDDDETASFVSGHSNGQHSYVSKGTRRSNGRGQGFRARRRGGPNNGYHGRGPGYRTRPQPYLDN